MPDKHAMAEKHEKDTAEALGGHPTRGSGNQWAHKGDVTAGDHLSDEFALLVECKATAGASVSVTWAWLEKILGEANGERPMLALRFYEGSDQLDVRPHGDWWVLEKDDVLELLEKAHHPLMIRDASGDEVSDEELAALRQAVDQYRQQEVQYRAKNAGLREAKSGLERRVEDLERQLQEARKQLAEGPQEASPAVPGHVPAPLPELPWTVIYQHQLPGGGVGRTAVYYDVNGHPNQLQVNSVRVEPVTATMSRLMVNDQIVRGGDLYINGKLALRVGK